MLRANRQGIEQPAVVSDGRLLCWQCGGMVAEIDARGNWVVRHQQREHLNPQLTTCGHGRPRTDKVFALCGARNILPPPLARHADPEQGAA